MLAGQPPEAFARVTFREASIVIEASMARDARQAWLVAQYNRFAFHDPNEMPEDPAQSAAPAESNTKADAAYVRAWMKAVSKGSKHGN